MIKKEPKLSSEDLEFLKELEEKETEIFQD